MISEVLADLLLEAFPTMSVTHGVPRSNTTRNFICVTADTEGLIRDLPDTASVSIVSEGVSLKDLRDFFKTLVSLHVGEHYIQRVHFRTASESYIQVPGGQPIPTILSSWLCLHS